MQTITKLLKNDKQKMNIKVPQYPLAIDDMERLIKTHNMDSADVLSSVAHKCEDTIEKQRKVFSNMIDNYFPMESIASKEDKLAKLMYQYFSSYYGDSGSTKALKDLYPLADGYNAVLSSFTNYHAHRLEDKHERLQRLLLDNRISPICQPMYLTFDYDKLYMLDDNTYNFTYDRQYVKIVDVTNDVYELLKSCGVIPSDIVSFKHWCIRVLLKENTITTKYIGKVLAQVLFQYKENDCFIVSLV